MTPAAAIEAAVAAALEIIRAAHAGQADHAATLARLRVILQGALGDVDGALARIQQAEAATDAAVAAANPHGGGSR